MSFSILRSVTYRLGRLLHVSFDPLALSEGGPERSKIGTTVDVVISLKQRLDRIGRFLRVVVWYAAEDGISWCMRMSHRGKLTGRDGGLRVGPQYDERRAAKAIQDRGQQ